MTIQPIHASMPQFGRLVLREKSLAEKAELDTKQQQWYRRARVDRKQAIENLERAGIDIEVRGIRSWTGEMTPETEHGAIETFVLDKDRNILASTTHSADASPWNVVDTAIARALNTLKLEKAEVTDEPRYTPVAKMEKGKLVSTGEGVTHRLSHRGRRVETGRFQIDA